jgi:hypothetical protein
VARSGYAIKMQNRIPKKLEENIVKMVKMFFLAIFLMKRKLILTGPQEKLS